MVDSLDDLGASSSDDLVDKGGHPADPGDTADAEVVSVTPGVVGDFVENPEAYGGDEDQDAIEVTWKSPWMEDEDGEPYERSAFLNITYGEEDGERKVSKQCQLGQFIHAQGIDIADLGEGDFVKVQAYRGDDDNIYEEVFTGT